MQMRKTWTKWMALLVLVVALLAGCGSDSDDGAATTTAAEATATAVDSTATPSLEGKITVSAAASLRDAFTAIAADVNETNPDLEIEFNFDSSSTLATQIIEGAPADVFASADEKNMDKAVDAGLVPGKPVIFATNTLTIVTGPGNPKGIASLADLTKPGVTVVICAPQVPCGAAAQKVQDTAGLKLRPVSEESAAADVLGKVVSGQADAGLVYVTDANSAGERVGAVRFPESRNAVNSYPITALRESKSPAVAQMFVDLVTGPDGERALTDAGFVVP